MQKQGKFGELLMAITLVVGSIYLAYKVPFWLDNQWKVAFCYLATLLLVLAGIILVVEQIGSNKEGK